MIYENLERQLKMNHAGKYMEGAVLRMKATNFRNLKIRIGLRTIKTVMAVIISMMVVNIYGATTSKLTFAMLGAMAAVQPSFKESWESCLTQFVGVFCGAAMGIVLLFLQVPYLVATGIGMIIVITFYNVLKIPYSPSLPCMIVVTICTTPDIQPMMYALGRIWDSAIGLGIGMGINMLICPYDNSREIRATVESLDKELILFLEDMFDGDDILPNAKKVSKKINCMNRQLKLFENQRLLTHLQKQRKDLESYRDCQGKAHQLISHMEVLAQMNLPGRLSAENRSRLFGCGAEITDARVIDEAEVLDVVTNYHVEQILNLRKELLAALGRVKEESVE